MRLGRRRLCAGALAGLAGLSGCTQPSEPAQSEDGLESPETPQLRTDARPPRPPSLDPERVADYVERYEVALWVQEAVEHEAFDEPSDAVSLDCDVAVRELSGERFFAVPRCSGTIRPDPDTPIELSSGTISATLYLVTPSETRRLAPGGTPDTGYARERTFATAVNLGDEARTVAVSAESDASKLSQHLLGAWSAYVVGFPDVAAGSVTVTAAVGDGPRVTKTVSKAEGDPIAIYVVADGDGPPQIATLSPPQQGAFTVAGSSPQ